MKPYQTILICLFVLSLLGCTHRKVENHAEVALEHFIVYFEDLELLTINEIEWLQVKENKDLRHPQAYYFYIHYVYPNNLDEDSIEQKALVIMHESPWNLIGVLFQDDNQYDDSFAIYQAKKYSGEASGYLKDKQINTILEQLKE